MFDLRYHVASLAAVFLALIVGILVGVAISDPGLADRTELRLKDDEIARLNEQLDAASRRSRQQAAAEEFVEAGYTAIMKDRLAGKRILVVFVGSVDQGLSSDVDDALADAGTEDVRLRALTVPIQEEAIEAALRSRSGLAGYLGSDHLDDLGRDLGRELVDGGETPLWDLLADELLEERRGPGGQEAQAVVVLRTSEPQRGRTARFLRGFYAGLAAAGPVVGAEATTSEPSAVNVFREVDFSSIDSIDTRLGKVSLAVLLAGGIEGHYGVKETAEALVPPIEPVEPPPDAGA
jgi:hypothetical protein